MSLTPHQEPLKRAALCGLILAVATSVVGAPQSRAASPSLGIAVVASAICGNNVVEAGEECDDGGTCLGGQDAGKHCTSESDCPGDGVCQGGPKVSTPCSNDLECPGSICRRCVPQGGDDCAANCTTEATVPFPLEPGRIDDLTQTIVEGTSGAVVHGNLQIPLPVSGAQSLIIGKAKNGSIPVIMKAASVQIPEIDAMGLACACVRGGALKTCGGTAFTKTGAAARDCTPGFSNNGDVSIDGPCPADLPCAFVHGEGNAATGVIGCNGLDGTELFVTQDDANAATACTADAQCASLPGSSVCVVDPDNAGGKLCSAAPPSVTVSGSGPPGSAILLNSAAIGQLIGACATAPSFCSDTDPFSNRGTISTARLTTGTAGAELTTAGGVPDSTVCLCKDPEFQICALSDCAGPWSVRGAPFNCSDLANGSAAGAALVGSSTSPHAPIAGDAVVAFAFVASGTRPPATCVGDCNRSGQVAGDDLLLSLNAALGHAAVTSCVAGNPDHDATITVAEILAAINSAAGGCGVCGGITGLPCRSGTFCEFPFGTCGAGDITGICIPIPEPPCICTADVNPVCGCDGQTYSNACGARCAGVSVAHIDACL